MKMNKLNITDLKVKSFVTGLGKDKAETAKGGGGITVLRMMCTGRGCQFY